MAKNHDNYKDRGLAGAVADCGWYEIRRQREDKAAMRSGRIVIADRLVLPVNADLFRCGASQASKAERNRTLKNGAVYYRRFERDDPQLLLATVRH
jgi:hypothetical protein